MTSERPWLLYPIGRLDVDPEDVITLPWVSCHRAHRPTRFCGCDRLVWTITFFGLDDVIGRKNLMLDRARTILLCLLYYELVRVEDQWDANNAPHFIDELLAPTARHANCARSFVRLFRSNRDTGDRGRRPRQEISAVTLVVNVVLGSERKFAGSQPSKTARWIDTDDYDRVFGSTV